MRSVNTTLAALGLGVALIAGIGLLGASPAKADSLGIRDYNGHFGFSLNLGAPPYYYGPYPGYWYGPDYGPNYDYGPYYGGGYWRGNDRDNHREFHRDFRGGHDFHGDRGRGDRHDRR